MCVYHLEGVVQCSQFSLEDVESKTMLVRNSRLRDCDRVGDNNPYAGLTLMWKPGEKPVAATTPAENQVAPPSQSASSGSNDGAAVTASGTAGGAGQKSPPLTNNEGDSDKKSDSSSSDDSDSGSD